MELLQACLTLSSLLIKQFYLAGFFSLPARHSGSLWEEKNEPLLQLPEPFLLAINIHSSLFYQKKERKKKKSHQSIGINRMQVIYKTKYFCVCMSMCESNILFWRGFFFLAAFKSSFPCHFHVCFILAHISCCDVYFLLSVYYKKQRERPGERDLFLCARNALQSQDI